MRPQLAIKFSVWPSVENVCPHLFYMNRLVLIARVDQRNSRTNRDTTQSYLIVAPKEMCHTLCWKVLIVLKWQLSTALRTLEGHTSIPWSGFTWIETRLKCCMHLAKPKHRPCNNYAFLHWLSCFDTNWKCWNPHACKYQFKPRKNSFYW